MKQLILGGARSGKSALAEQLAGDSGKRVIYLATSNPVENDAEMTARIAHHRLRRPDHWQLVEEPLKLAETLQAIARDDLCILVDCLTLWLSNCLFDQQSECWSQQRQQLLDCLPDLPGEIIIVSNEVGMGIVPMGEINRRFVDESGFLHQAVAKLCDRVIFTVAGLPIVMKGDDLVSRQ